MLPSALFLLFTFSSHVSQPLAIVPFWLQHTPWEEGTAPTAGAFWSVAGPGPASTRRSGAPPATPAPSTAASLEAALKRLWRDPAYQWVLILSPNDNLIGSRCMVVIKFRTHNPQSLEISH